MSTATTRQKASPAIKPKNRALKFVLVMISLFAALALLINFLVAIPVAIMGLLILLLGRAELAAPLRNSLITINAIALASALLSALTLLTLGNGEQTNIPAVSSAVELDAP